MVAWTTLIGWTRNVQQSRRQIMVCCSIAIVSFRIGVSRLLVFDAASRQCSNERHEVSQSIAVSRVDHLLSDFFG
jgi:hypothetical protein